MLNFIDPQMCEACGNSPATGLDADFSDLALCTECYASMQIRLQWYDRAEREYDNTLDAPDAIVTRLAGEATSEDAHCGLITWLNDMLFKPVYYLAVWGGEVFGITGYDFTDGHITAYLTTGSSVKYDAYFVDIFTRKPWEAGAVQVF